MKELLRVTNSWKAVNIYGKTLSLPKIEFSG